MVTSFRKFSQVLSVRKFSKVTCDITLGDGYQREVRPMLDLVNDLQHILQDHTEVPLPRIAVVGNQSSGKSSVLERLSSVQLPRATGLCTRVPLVLSMKKSDTAEITCKIALDGSKRKKINLEDVSNQIADATAKLAGAANGIVDKSINLYVEGPGVPELTLVDLPGIVYTPAKGQPTDISAKVRELILRHIKPKETLILCVFDGTTDIQASEALKLAREVDATGERTLGIITKVDRCEDKSTLSNRILQLGKEDMNIALGLIALRNRTVSELKDARDVPLQEVMEKEQQFFDTTPELSHTPSSHLGITALIAKLCNLQLDLLKKVLPGIGESLLVEVRRGEDRLFQIKGCKTAAESFDRVQRELDQLKLALRCIACGDYVLLDELCPCELRLVPDLTKTLEAFIHALAQKAPKVFDSVHVKQAKKALVETKGHGLPNFLSHEPFQGLMRKWHEPYDVIVMQAFGLVAKLVRQTFITAVNNVTSVPLQGFFVRRVAAALDMQDATAKAQLELVLKIEKRVIDTLNNYYITTLRQLEQFSKTPKDDEVSLKQARERLCALISDGDQNNQEAETVLDHISSKELSHDPDERNLLKLQLSAFCYNKVVRKRIGDQVMQILRYHYIEYARDELGFRLASGLTKEQAHQLLRCSAQEEAERAKLEAMIDACKRGIARIDEAGGQLTAVLNATSASSGFKDVQFPEWASLEVQDMGKEDPVVISHANRTEAAELTQERGRKKKRKIIHRDGGVEMQHINLEKVLSKMKDTFESNGAMKSTAKAHIHQESQIDGEVGDNIPQGEETVPAGWPDWDEAMQSRFLNWLTSSAKRQSMLTSADGGGMEKMRVLAWEFHKGPT